jgi:hypothetical protein
MVSGQQGKFARGKGLNATIARQGEEVAISKVRKIVIN